MPAASETWRAGARGRALTLDGLSQRVVACVAMLTWIAVVALRMPGRRGDPAQHRHVAQRVVDALGVTRAWSNTDVVRVVDPVTLKVPPGSTYGWSRELAGATFEEVSLLEGDGFAALVLWTGED